MRGTANTNTNQSQNNNNQSQNNNNQSQNNNNQSQNNNNQSVQREQSIISALLGMGFKKPNVLKVMQSLSTQH